MPVAWSASPHESRCTRDDSVDDSFCSNALTTGMASVSLHKVEANLLGVNDRYSTKVKSVTEPPLIVTPGEAHRR